MIDTGCEKNRVCDGHHEDLHGPKGADCHDPDAKKEDKDFKTMTGRLPATLTPVMDLVPKIPTLHVMTRRSSCPMTPVIKSNPDYFAFSVATQPHFLHDSTRFLGYL